MAAIMVHDEGTMQLLDQLDLILTQTADDPKREKIADDLVFKAFASYRGDIPEHCRVDQLGNMEMEEFRRWRRHKHRLVRNERPRQAMALAYRSARLNQLRISNLSLVWLTNQRRGEEANALLAPLTHNLLIACAEAGHKILRSMPPAGALSETPDEWIARTQFRQVRRIFHIARLFAPEVIPPEAFECRAMHDLHLALEDRRREHIEHGQRALKQAQEFAEAAGWGEF